MATLVELNALLAATFDHHEISASTITAGSHTWENAGSELVEFYRVRGLELKDDDTYKVHVLDAVKYNDGVGADVWSIGELPDDSSQGESDLYDYCETTFTKVISFQYNKQTRSASVWVFDGSPLALEAYIVGEHNGGYQHREVTASTLVRLFV